LSFELISKKIGTQDFFAGPPIQLLGMKLKTYKKHELPRRRVQMIDSDIMGNITADCGQLPQKQEMNEAHEIGCTCDSCCHLSESNCQDNLDQYEETQQPSGGMKKMRSKLTPIMASCGILLAIVVLAGQIARASNIPGSDTIQINPDIQTRTARARVGVVIREISDAASTVSAIDVIDSADIDADVVGVEQASIGAAINVEYARVDVEKHISPIEPAEANYIHASVNYHIIPTIRN
jgi:hypothetical protein